jgi:hypothetical protein
MDPFRRSAAPGPWATYHLVERKNLDAVIAIAQRIRHCTRAARLKCARSSAQRAVPRSGYTLAHFMSRTAGKSVALTRSHAKRIWLRAQRLDEYAPFGGGPEATLAAVEHLGYVQIDKINVIERCHHQILYTRIPAYQRDICARRRPSTRRSSSTGLMSCHTCRPRTCGSTSGP